MSYPWAPLEPVLNAMFNNTRAVTSEYGWSDDDAAEVLRISRRHMLRMKSEGLTIVWADRIAIRLGRMPSDIWPEWEADSEAWANAWCDRQDALPPNERAVHKREINKRYRAKKRAEMEAAA